MIELRWDFVNPEFEFVVFRLILLTAKGLTRASSLRCLHGAVRRPVKLSLELSRLFFVGIEVITLAESKQSVRLLSKLAYLLALFTLCDFKERAFLLRIHLLVFEVTVLLSSHIESLLEERVLLRCKWDESQCTHALPLGELKGIVLFEEDEEL